MVIHTEGGNNMQFNIEDYKSRLPGVIRSCRRKQDTTQKALAKKAGMSDKTIIDLENNNFNNLTIATVQKVCNALDIKVVFVLSGG